MHLGSTWEALAAGRTPDRFDGSLLVVVADLRRASGSDRAKLMRLDMPGALAQCSLSERLTLPASSSEETISWPARHIAETNPLSDRLRGK